MCALKVMADVHKVMDYLRDEWEIKLGVTQGYFQTEIFWVENDLVLDLDSDRWVCGQIVG